MNAKMEPRLNSASSVTNHSEVPDVEAFVFSPRPPALSPEKAMAGGVLRQAAYDLRRFRGATSGVERQLYLDAYDGSTAEYFPWPSFFVNIGHFLNLPPEGVRQGLLDDASVGPFGYMSRRCARPARSPKNFSIRFFTKNRRSTGTDPVSLTH